MKAPAILGAFNRPKETGDAQPPPLPNRPRQPLEMSPRTLERWRFTGEGPQFIKIGGRVVYRLEDIEAFEARQLRQVTPGLRRGPSGGQAA